MLEAWIASLDDDELRQKVHNGITIHDDGGVTLNLEWKDIGDEGVVQLGSGSVATNTTLAVNLWGNHIGAEGATQVARALETNTTLTELNLEGNDIGDEGAMQLAGP